MDPRPAWSISGATEAYYEQEKTGGSSRAIEYASGHLNLVPALQARSQAWKHFGFRADDNGGILDKTETICRICYQILPYCGSTGNMLSHLQLKHPDVRIEKLPSNISVYLQKLSGSKSNTKDNAVDYQAESNEAESDTDMDSQSNESESTESEEDKGKPYNDPAGGTLVPPPSGRSHIWKHFGFEADKTGHISDKTMVICKHCSLRVPYQVGTSNLFSHLKAKHRKIKVMKLPPKSNFRRRSKKEIALGLPPKPHKSSSQDDDQSTDADSNSDENEDDDGLPKKFEAVDGGSRSVPEWALKEYSKSNSRKRARQPEEEPASSSFFISPPSTVRRGRGRGGTLTADDLTKQLAYYLVTDFRPLSSIYSAGFKQLFSLVAPGYEIPNHSVMKSYIEEEVTRQRMSFVANGQHPARR